MGKRDHHPPGALSWADLATSDADAAKAFYGGVFRWSYEDAPAGENGVYSTAKRDGEEVAGLFESAEQPPHWNCYVTVESADAKATEATRHGGSVMMEPFDAMDAGRMAVIVDPTGAALCLWEPRGSIGATLVNTPGSMTWNDLITPDADAATEFYGAMFGWTTEEIPESGGYRVIRNGDRMNGGMMPHDPQRMGDAPASWMPYFGHEDVHRLVEEIEGLGGRLLNGPMQMPQGAIAVLADPQGAVFAVWTGEYED